MRGSNLLGSTKLARKKIVAQLADFCAASLRPGISGRPVLKAVQRAVMSSQIT
jgi:hypothetical protein